MSFLCLIKTLSNKFWTGLSVGKRDKNANPNNAAIYLISNTSFGDFISCNVKPARTAIKVCAETPNCNNKLFISYNLCKTYESTKPKYVKRDVKYRRSQINKPIR